MIAKEYDVNLIADCKIGKYDIEFHDAKSEPFRLYGVWHDGERYVRIPKESTMTLTKPVIMCYNYVIFITL